MNISGLPLFENKGYINGVWCDADDNSTLEVTNPADNRLLGTVPNMAQVETARAIDAAHIAGKKWAIQTAKDRAEIMMNWFSLIMENREELAKILVAEQGKPFAEAIGEITYGASFIKWFAEEGKRAYGDIIPAQSPNTQIRVTKEPVGVAGIIIPWNFPVAMVTRKCAAALAAGCSCVIKPAEFTPYSAIGLLKLGEQAGLPAGLLNLVIGKAVPIGEEITSNPKVKKVSFTGSTAIGKLIMEQCAKTVKKISLELGGNAPFIVFEDADLDAAVAGAIASKFRNSGQTCVCANRFFVQSKVYDEFINKLKDSVMKLKLGNGMDEGVTQGPLINKDAVIKVEKHIKDALDKGAKLICGGKRHKLGGTFFEPTIIADMGADTLPYYEETFGPVAPIYKFDDEEAGIVAANNTEYGLSAYFYTKDLGRAYRVSQKLESGIVGVNCGIISNEVAPFGGVKESGIGREGSKYGIDEYLNIKYTLFTHE